MPDSHPPLLPIVLELAPLPREQAGPFVVLGVPKTADQKQIEEYWAKRIIWARKNQIKVSLEDINWAKEILSDPEKRVSADAASLNVDTTSRTLQELADKLSNASVAMACRPIDEENDLSDYEPRVDIPNIDEIKQTIELPDIPREFPIIQHVMEEFAKASIDPWELEFPNPN